MRITRIAIDNFKCFVGFDFKPQAIQPIFGLNGTGKSLLFQVLELLRHFLLGRNHSANLFPSSTLTRWESSDTQTFRIETESPEFRFEYDLILIHDRSTGYTRVRSETLTSDGDLVFRRSETETSYIRDDGSRAPNALLDVRYSGIGFEHKHVESRRLDAFRAWANTLTNISIDPFAISSRSEAASEELEWGAGNFTSWIRHLEQTRPSALADLSADLKEVIGGYQGTRLVPDGQARLLRIEMRPFGGTVSDYELEELSDGQRQLMVLYAVLNGRAQAGDATICLDEPDNYLAPAEIQPFLVRLRDAVGEGFSQVFVATHNPEAINYLAADEAVIFDREDSGPVKILPFPEVNPAGITAAELLTRGWIE